jgi:hypothetical protein
MQHLQLISIAGTVDTRTILNSQVDVNNLYVTMLMNQRLWQHYNNPPKENQSEQDQLRFGAIGS